MFLHTIDFRWFWNHNLYMYYNKTGTNGRQNMLHGLFNFTMRKVSSKLCPRKWFKTAKVWLLITKIAHESFWLLPWTLKIIHQHEYFISTACFSIPLFLANSPGKPTSVEPSTGLNSCRKSKADLLTHNFHWKYGHFLV